MKNAMLLPLLMGLLYMSAQIPPTTLIAALPPIPTNNLKMTSAAKFGARAEATENTVSMKKAYIITPLRP